MKIVEKIKMAVMGLSAVATLGTAAMVAPSVYATDSVVIGANETTNSAAGKYTSGSESKQQAATGRSDDLMSVLTVIINVALGVIGFIAVVMIILGGVQYTTSSGDAAKVTKAKNTILYGIVGLVVALLAFAIVNFVLGNVFKTGA